jgi:hypothetical protein
MKTSKQLRREDNIRRNGFNTAERVAYQVPVMVHAEAIVYARSLEEAREMVGDSPRVMIAGNTAAVSVLEIDWSGLRKVRY